VVHRLSAGFSVVTPLFGGGAQPDASAEVRPPSLKGVLRFWWRALAWSRLAGDLREIRALEAKIFGAAGDENTGRQGSFLLRVLHGPPPRCLRKGEVLTPKQPVGPGARYFGYGLFGAKAGQLKRPCLLAPITFTAELVSRGSLDATVVDALKLMGLLGRLGSRTRRGWGSLSLLSLQGDTEWQAAGTVPEYKSELRKLLSGAATADEEPPYSALSRHTHIDIVGEDRDPLRLLNGVGEAMLRYRSWGKNGQVLGRDSERNFQPDHDWSKNPQGVTGIRHPRRVIFGLPHNYSKTLGVTAEHFDRRASPLMIHIHRLTDQNHVAVLTVLRSAYLPNGERLEVTNGRGETLRDATPDWSVLDGFIKRWSKKKGDADDQLPIKVLP
jgi:CRISPR-associated protein Cmr1